MLITGSTGLLGSALEKLLIDDYNVYTINRSTSNLLDFDGDNMSTLGIELQSESIDAIYYLAQSRQFRDFPGGAEDMFRINIEVPLKLIHWGQKYGVRKFIYASSGGIYTNPSRPSLESDLIDASEIKGFYLGSKLCAEILLNSYASLFETFVVARPFFIYGPGQDSGMLIPRLIKNVLNKKELDLSHPNGIKINPIFVMDAAKSFKAMLNLEGQHTINIGGDETLSLRELAELIGEVVSVSPIFNTSTKAQNDVIGDITFMEKHLHRPEVSMKDGLALTYHEMSSGK